jgi:hypothetical protein
MCLYNNIIEYTNYINDIMDYKDSNSIIISPKNKATFYFVDLFANESLYVPSYFIKNNFINDKIILSNTNLDVNLDYISNIYSIMSSYNYKLMCYYDIKYVNILQDIVDKLEKGIGT